MPDFLNRHTLHLTPLSPIHLGTGEDYEPTNYVIKQDGIDSYALYAFDPARAYDGLNETQQNELLDVAKTGDIQRIQKYFGKYPMSFIKVAYNRENPVSVSTGVAEEYKERFGQTAQHENSGKKVLNQLEIKRTATNPHSHAPFIPGSALKGCLRTALMESYSEKQPPTEDLSKDKAPERYEKKLLGDFATDLLRLVKPSDLFATNDTATHICYATNHKKKIVIGKDGKPAQSKGPPIRCEIIQHGQYRIFSGSLTLQNLLLEHQPRLKNDEETLPAETRPDLVRLIQAVNRYHLRRFSKETTLFAERGLVAAKEDAWLNQTKQLLAQIRPQLDAGELLFVRLGKNGGAESKTLEKYARIKITGKKGDDPTYEKETKTIWLAAESRRATHNLLPFGWALIEIDPIQNNEAIKTWCEQNQAHLLSQLKRQEKQREAAAKAAALAEKQAEEAAEAARVSALPAHERLAHDILARLEEHSKTYSDRNQDKNLALHRDILATLEQAHSELDSASQKQLAELLPYKKLESTCKGFYSGKKEKDIKQVLQKLRGA